MELGPHITRRTFGATLAGASALPAVQGGRVTVIDSHAHLAHHSRPDWAEADRQLIDAADKLGINQLCCSLLSPRRPTTAEEFRQCNDWAAEAMKRYPGRILCYAYVNPGYVRETREEVKRCVEKLGFIGVKLYNEYLATEPVVWPLVEQCIEMRIPMLHHAGHCTWLNPPQPRISDGGTFAELAKRYPEAMVICAHVAGGGDWEWTIKALRNAPSIYLDTSGSVPDEGVVEMCVRVLGASRILFGCDMSMTSSVGRIRSAVLSDSDRVKIMGANMQAILARRKSA